MNTQWKKVLLALAVPAVMGVSGQAPAQVPDYYKGKVLTIVVAGSPAGGHTRFARLIAPYLQKHLGASDVRILSLIHI